MATSRKDISWRLVQEFVDWCLDNGSKDLQTFLEMKDGKAAKQARRAAYARAYYKANREKRIEAAKRCQAKRKAVSQGQKLVRHG